MEFEEDDNDEEEEEIKTSKQQKKKSEKNLVKKQKLEDNPIEIRKVFDKLDKHRIRGNYDFLII